MKQKDKEKTKAEQNAIKAVILKSELNEERSINTSNNNSTATTDSSNNENLEEIKEEEIKTDDKSDHKNKEEPKAPIFTHTDISSLFSDYNMKFLTSWSRTYNFQKWKLEHHPHLAYLDPYCTVLINLEINYENGDKYHGELLGGK